MAVVWKLHHYVGNFIVFGLVLTLSEYHFKRESHGDFFNNTDIVAKNVRFDVKTMLFQRYDSTLIIQKTCYLFDRFQNKEAMAVLNIIKHAHVSVANNNLEVVVVINDESELLVHIK